MMLGRITTRALSTGARQVIQDNEKTVRIPNLSITANEQVEDVFIVSAARTPLGSMEGCLKVESANVGEHIDILDMTCHL